MKESKKKNGNWKQVLSHANFLLHCLRLHTLPYLKVLYNYLLYYHIANVKRLLTAPSQPW